MDLSSLHHVPASSMGGTMTLAIYNGPAVKGCAAQPPQQLEVRVWAHGKWRAIDSLPQAAVFEKAFTDENDRRCRQYSYANTKVRVWKI